VQLGIDIDGEATNDGSGRSVSLSADGSRVAIGGDGSAGHVRVFDWDAALGTPAWSPVGVRIDGAVAGDDFGTSVSLSADGSRVAIGAPKNDGAGVRAGHVRIYDWNGTTWIRVGADIRGEAAEDQSGLSVSLSADGSRVAIGAPFNDGSGASAGHVRVYRWDAALSTPAWVQVGDDIEGEAAEDRSGRSVSLSADGSRVAIGAENNAGGGTWRGHVRVFDWDGIRWTQVGADIDGVADDDRSGVSALSADGSRVAIGARLHRLAGVSVGHVRVFALPAPLVPASTPMSLLAVSCGEFPLIVGSDVTCTVAGGDPGIEILWRAAYNPVFAEAGVALDTSGAGEFAFTVPAAALGEEVTVELVEWLAPVSLGVAAGPVPSSIPSGGGPMPVWSLVLLALAGGLVLRRMSAVGVRG
jgi:hypothetical protein